MKHFCLLNWIDISKFKKKTLFFKVLIFLAKTWYKDYHILVPD